MSKRLALTGLLLAAAGGPIVYSTAPGWWTALRQSWLPAPEPLAGQPASMPPPEKAPDGEAAVGPLDGKPVQDLADVFRFDVTPGWVLRRWPRVSTGLAELPLQGYRVPLVTGVAETDLAGALTYHFNPQQQLQRITFQGTTGNPRELIRLLTTRYRFTRRLTNDPGLFVYEVPQPGGEATSVLEIRPVGVIKSSEPNRRFEVDLVLERPSP